MEKSQIEWTREQTSRLIEFYRVKQLLWNPNHNDFKNRNKKHDAWVDLANTVGSDAEEVEKKTRMLVGQFQRELKKGKSGDGAEAFYKTKWIHFKSLLFLQDRNTPKHHQEIGIEEAQGTGNSDDLNEMQETQDLLTQPLLQDDTRYSPTPTKMKKMENQDDKIVMEAFEVMKILRGGIKERDEFDVFGENVAHSLRKLKSEQLLLDAKFQINNILYHTERSDQTLSPFESPVQTPIASTSSTITSPAMPSENDCTEDKHILS